MNDLLPETYDARIDERERLIERTVSEPERRTARLAISKPAHTGQPQTAAGVLTLEPVTIDLPVEELVEVHDRWIEIRHRPDRKLVTAIEVLSPTNKTGEGFHDYCSKRRSLIRQQVHLVEFDFLIRGQRLPMKQACRRATSSSSPRAPSGGPNATFTAGQCVKHCPAFRSPCWPPTPTSSSTCKPSSPPATTAAAMPGPLDYTAPLDLPLSQADRAWAEETAKGREVEQLERWTFAKAHSGIPSQVTR